MFHLYPLSRGTSLFEIFGVPGGQIIQAVNENVVSVLVVTIGFLDLPGLEIADSKQAQF